jgi:DNA-binding Lrp family transcriptional regulator
MTTMDALVFVNILEGASPIEVARGIKELSGVEEVMLISGQWDLVVKFGYEKMDELSDFVVSQLRKVSGVGKTDTNIILDQLK